MPRAGFFRGTLVNIMFETAPITQKIKELENRSVELRRYL